jgi:hypothetical protein
MKFLQVFSFLSLIVLLTFFTQIGGLILLLCLPVFIYFPRNIQNKWSKLGIRAIFFITIYLLATFYAVPPLAKKLGKVPMPFANKYVKPANRLYCILNRNYVVPDMRQTSIKVGKSLAEEFPGTELQYLDGGFPFFNMRLFPHFDHSTGYSLDVALFYKTFDGKSTNEKTSNSGYGVFVEPTEEERNRPRECHETGHWQYSFTEYLTFGGSKKLLFDAKRTKRMVQLYAEKDEVRYMLLEPHVRERMNLKEKKMHLQGCTAVRHDDHVHVRVW